MITSHTLCNERIAELEAELEKARWAITQWQAEEDDWVRDREALEAEVARLTERCQMWHAEANTQRVNAEDAETKVEHLHEVLEQNAAEMVALKAQRCETCRLQFTCYIGRVVREQDAAPLGVSCNCWEARP